MADPELSVFYRGRIVGRLFREPLTFSYDPSWLSAADAFAISVALPLQAAPFGEAPARAFFFNLLPEAGARRRLAGRLGISEGNDYAILTAIGGECAGALSISTSSETEPEQGEYEPISGEKLARWIATGGAPSAAAAVEGVRLSLAGAQDKLPVYIDEQGLFLPKWGAPSSHILKFDGRDFKQLTLNELFVLRLAKAAGLPAVRAELLRFGRSAALCVERYDRSWSSGALQRLHQEDLCQALGVPAERKYEAEGGPSIASCVEVVRKFSADPLSDTAAVIRWQLFNAAAGNADGHGKNLALIHAAGGTRLAPYYDLVCTRAYPRVDRRLAMSIGGNSDPDALRGDDWKRFAAQLGVGERFLRETAAGLVTAVQDAAQPTLRALEKEFGRKDFLRSAVLPEIRSATRRLELSLTRR